MNLRSNALVLSVFSDRMLRVGLYLPFAVLILFALLSFYSRAFPGFASGEVSMPSLSVLQDQRAFLITKGLVRGLNVDFIIFEAFIWIALIVGLLRFSTGFFSVRVLNSYRAKIESRGKRGMSPVGYLFFVFLVLPAAIFGSLNFEFVWHSNQMRFLMEYSPRFFLCLMAFIFCGCVIFLVEGVLLFVWAIFLSE